MLKMSRKGLDKFYAIQLIQKCIDKIFNLYDKTSFDLIIEPSAGNEVSLIN